MDFMDRIKKRQQEREELLDAAKPKKQSFDALYARIEKRGLRVEMYRKWFLALAQVGRNEEARWTTVARGKTLSELVEAVEALPKGAIEKLVREARQRKVQK